MHFQMRENVTTKACKMYIISQNLDSGNYLLIKTYWPYKILPLDLYKPSKYHFFKIIPGKFQQNADRKNIFNSMSWNKIKVPNLSNYKYH